MLVGCPGLKSWGSVTGLIRGMWTLGGALYVVAGSALYSVDAAGSATNRGAVTGNGRVSMAASATHLAIATAGTGYYYTVAGGLVAITDTDFLPATFVDFQDGFFVWTAGNGSVFFLATLADPFSFIATDTGTPSARGDALVVAIVSHRNIWLFGTETIEIWYNTGNDDFPFSRLQGTTREKGIAAGATVIRVADALAWLGNDGKVYRSRGHQIEVISTKQLEQKFQGLALETAFATTYVDSGHEFYCLNFPEGGGTFVSDFATEKWHERDSQNSISESLGRWRAAHTLEVYGKNIAGDSQNSNLHEISLETYDERGLEIEGIVTFPYVHKERLLLFFYMLEIDMETGVGNVVTPGDDPKVMLRISDDGGRTFKARTLVKPLGKLGKYLTRIRWFRLGSSRTRVFQVLISDPVKRRMIAAHIRVGLGAS